MTGGRPGYGSRTTECVNPARFPASCHERRTSPEPSAMCALSTSPSPRRPRRECRSDCPQSAGQCHNIPCGSPYLGPRVRVRFREHCATPTRRPAYSSHLAPFGKPTALVGALLHGGGSCGTGPDTLWVPAVSPDGRAQMLGPPQRSTFVLAEAWHQCLSGRVPHPTTRLNPRCVRWSPLQSVLRRTRHLTPPFGGRLRRLTAGA